MTGGTATQLGGQDWDHLLDLLEGVADVEAITINSNWTFRSGKMRLRNPLNSFSYVFAAGALVADRTITYPVLSADDVPLFQAAAQPITGKTIAVGSNTVTGILDTNISAHTTTKITTLSKSLLNTSIGYIDQANTWAGIQKFDVAPKLKPVTNPTTDTSYGQLYPDSADSNNPKFKKPDGTIINLVQGTSGAGSPYIYDALTSTYTLTSDNQLSPNSLWRRQYAGSMPGNPGDVGIIGVRAPSGGAFTNVVYMYPYSGTYTGSSTSASLLKTEAPYFTDVDFTLSMRTIDQRKSTFVQNHESAWLLFRFNEADGTNFHHYYLVLKVDGTLELGRKDNTTHAEEQTFLSTGVTYSYTLTGWNKVRIRAVQNHITVYVDDVQKIDIIDDGTVGTHVDSILGTIATLAPSTAMYSGKIGLYNEDAEVEFSAMTVTDLAGSGSAPLTASYLTLATDSGLSNERVATAGNGITLTDAGAGGALTITARERLLTRLVTETNLVSSTTETDILAYTVAAGTLGTDKAIRVMIKADYQNNSGSNRTFTLKLKYGATTMYSSATPSFATSADRYVCRFEFILFAKNSATAQGLHGSVKIGDDSTATIGLGNLNGNATSSQDIQGVDAAENSAVGKTLSVTIQHSASASTISFRRKYASVELLD